MSYSGGVLESSSNIFIDSSVHDFVFRTVDYNEQLILGNTPTSYEHAGLYISKNNVGIHKLPGNNLFFDAPGLTCDFNCNVNVTNKLTVSNLVVSGNITPTVDIAFDLGTASNRFRDLYLSGSTIYFGGIAMSKTSNGDVQFVDPGTSNFKSLYCGEVNIGTATITATAAGELQFKNKLSNTNITQPVSLGLLSNIGYDPVNNFWGMGNSAPLSTLHFYNSNVAQQMRLIFTDRTTTTNQMNTVGYQFWKDTAGHGYLQNYFSGGTINIKTTGTQSTGAPNINIGDVASTGQVYVYSMADALVNLQSANQASNAGMVLDAATPGYTSGVGGRKFYIRASGNTAKTTSGTAGERAGLLEIGDLGGNTGDPDKLARSNLMVLDKFSRLWVGRNIVPAMLGSGAAVVGSGSNNDTQPALIIVGHSNSGGLKPPLIHLGRNATQSNTTGFGLKLTDNVGSNTLVIGRSDIKSNNGNPTYSNDVTIDQSGNVGIGTGGTLSNRLTINDDMSTSSGGHTFIAVKNTSFLGVQPISQAGDFNALVASNDTRVTYSNASGGLAFVASSTSSNRKGLRLSAIGTHEIAGDVFVNGKLGVGISNPSYDFDVSGRLRVTSNADFSFVSASNAYIAPSGSLSVSSITSCSDGSLSIGCDTLTSVINIACANCNNQVVNLGTGGACNTVINIGGAGDTVNILGITNTVTAINTTLCNKTIEINTGGAAGTGGNAGINIQEANNVTGYIRTSQDRNAWVFKAPNTPEIRISSTDGKFIVGGLVVSTSSNVGIGTSEPTQAMDVAGAVNATSYCNMQWSFLKGVPSLSGFSNDLTTFAQDIRFDGNITGTSMSISNLTVVNTLVSDTATIQSATITSLTGSNATLSNLTADIYTTQISGTAFGTAMTIGCDCNTSRVDIGVGATTLLNIGRNNVGTIINIGDVNDTVNIPGTLLATLADVLPQPDGFYTYMDYGLGTEDSNFPSSASVLVAPSLSIGTGLSPLGASSIVSDKFRIGEFSDQSKVLTLNKDNLPDSGSNCGIEIEENGMTSGWILTTPDRAGWSIKAPSANQGLLMSMGGNYVSFNRNSMIIVGESNGTIGMGTNNPNTGYKLHVAGPLYANQYYNLPVADNVGTSGIVSLCNAVNSSSTTVAATAQSVQTAYNLAAAGSNLAGIKWTAVNAGTVVRGIVNLNDATNSNNLDSTTSYAATPAAVAATYTFAATKWASNAASSTTRGVCYITDSTSCNMAGDTVPIAASARSVYLTNQAVATKWSASFASNSAPGYVYVSDATDCNRSWSTTDGLYQGPIAASVKAVYDTSIIAIAASNRAFTNVVATGAQLGSVLLLDSVNSTSSNTQSYAATPYAVSQAYTLAQTANSLAGTKWSNIKATGTQQGTVMLMDATNSNTLNASGTIPYAATPYAVSLAYSLATTASNRAYTGWQSVNASTSTPGIVYLTDATTCNAGATNSVPVVPTALALSNVNYTATTGSNQAFTHPSTVGSSNTAGHLKLSDAYNDTTNDITKGIAATPKAIGSLYNVLTTTTLSNIPTAQGSTTKGVVYLTDSTACNVSQTSQPLAASAMAVYNAYQMAVAASNWASQQSTSLAAGSLTQPGLLQLSDNTSNTSTSLAATIASVSRAYTLGSNALPKSGGTMTGDLIGTNIKTVGNITAGINSNFMQLWGDNMLIAKNSADMRLCFAADLVNGSLSETMRLTASGNVGIGTTSPAGPFHVHTGAYNVTNPATSGIYVKNYAGNNNMAHATLVLETFGASGGSPFISYNIPGVTGWCTGADISDGQKYKISTGSNSLYNAYLTITPAGNVGVGTASPAGPFHVNTGAINVTNPVASGVYVKNTAANNSRAHATVLLETSGSTGGSPYMTYNIPGVTGWTTGVDAADGQKFKVSTSSNSFNNTRLSIGTDGSIGINTTAPAGTLDVNGNTYIRGNMFLPTSGSSTLTAGAVVASNVTATTIVSSVFTSSNITTTTMTTNNVTANNITSSIITASNFTTGTINANSCTMSNITANMVTASTVECTGHLHTGTWSTGSDRSIKRDIDVLPVGLREILRLNPVQYHLKTDQPNDPLKYGLIAQEVQEVMPNVVETGRETLELRYGDFIAPIINSIKELNDCYKKDIQDKNTVISKLENTVAQLQFSMTKLEQTVRNTRVPMRW